MVDWSLCRREILRGIAVATIGSGAGCVAHADTGSGSDAIDLYVINETDSEVAVTLRYLSCEQVGDEIVTVGELNPGYYHFSANEIRSDSGNCSIEVRTDRGLADSYSWNVGERTLVVRVRSGSIRFTHRPPAFDP